MLTGAKAGDNAQVLKAAAATGLAFVEKRICLRDGHAAGKPPVMPSLAAVDEARSDALEAPWPDAVLCIGRQLSRVALWIRQKSGGRTRIALFNAPKGRAGDFALVVLPPWYRGSGASNVLSIRMPLIGIDEARIAAAAARLAPDVASMPRPLQVLLVGGDMGMRKLSPAFMANVLRQMTRDGGAGSIYAATSRRTPADVVAVLKAGLRPQDRLFTWGSGGDDNPYPGLLALGDSFTVTADSLSMLIEVARVGKPMAIAEPPPPRGLGAIRQRWGDLLRPRDLGKAVALLYEGGWAVPLGQPPRAPARPLPDDTALVAQRLRQLAGAKD